MRYQFLLVFVAVISVGTVAALSNVRDLITQQSQMHQYLDDVEQCAASPQSTPSELDSSCIRMREYETRTKP